MVYRQGKAWAEPWAPQAGGSPKAPCLLGFLLWDQQWERKETYCLLCRLEAQDQLLVKKRNALFLSLPGRNVRGQCLSPSPSLSHMPIRKALMGGIAGTLLYTLLKERKDQQGADLHGMDAHWWLTPWSGPRALELFMDQLPSDQVETGWRKSYWAGQDTYRGPKLPAATPSPWESVAKREDPNITSLGYPAYLLRRAQSRNQGRERGRGSPSHGHYTPDTRLLFLPLALSFPLSLSSSIYTQDG